MSREPKMNAGMAAALLGLQQPGSIPAAFVMTLVMYTLTPWREPTGRDLERARQTAARFKISDDLAIFVPREPGRFARRSAKDAFRGVMVALKQVDALEGKDREDGIAEVRMLLGARSA